jgi:hypothetical protein
VTAGRSRTILYALAALLVATSLAACGKENPRTHAKTEGPYLDVGPLQYQVQISRQLNPADTEDKAYFVGVANPEGQLKPDETWFGVWVRAWNRTDRAHPAAERFAIEDTTGKRYEPVQIGADNVFAYHPVQIPRNGTLPATDSVAEQGVIGGSLVLFKVTNESLANRPLILHIESPDPSARGAEVDLDV